MSWLFSPIFVKLNIVFVSDYNSVAGARERVVTDVLYKNSENIYNLLKNLEGASPAQTVVHPIGNFESFHNCQTWWEKMRY